MAKDKREPEPQEPQTTSPGDDWTRRHLWQIVPIRDLLIVLGVVGFFSLGARLSIVTVPLMLALMLSYLFDPLIRKLSAVSWLSERSRVVSLLLGCSAVVAISLAIGGVFASIQTGRLAGQLAKKVTVLVTSLDKPGDAEATAALGTGAWLSIRDTILELRDLPADPNGSGLRSDHLRFLGIDRDDIRAGVDLTADWLKNNSDSVAKQALETGREAVGSAFGLLFFGGKLLFAAFLTAFFFYFFANEWPQVLSFGRSLLPRANRERALEIVSRMDHAIAGFVRGRLLIGLFLAVFYSVGFALMGVPAPLVLGGVIAVLSLVPYAVIAGIPFVIILLWLESLPGFRGAWWWIIGAPVVYYNIGQVIDDYILTPAIQGKATDLATPEIVFASVAAGTLFGFFGLLVAIPLAACLKILLVEVVWPRYRAWSAGEAKG